MAMSRSAPIFEIYTDRKGEFRWRARARNGNLLAAASEGYAARRDAVHCAKLFGYEPAVLAPAPKKVAASKATSAAKLSGYEPTVAAPAHKKVAASKAAPAAKATKKSAAKKLAPEPLSAPLESRRVAKPKTAATA